MERAYDKQKVITMIRAFAQDQKYRRDEFNYSQVSIRFNTKYRAKTDMGSPLEVDSKSIFSLGSIPASSWLCAG